MSWTTDEAGVLRLDQFDARLDFAVAKTAPVSSSSRSTGRRAVVRGAARGRAARGRRQPASPDSARLAGHTLIWQDGFTTLRLEGDVTLDRAVEIAESVPVALTGTGRRLAV